MKTKLLSVACKNEANVAPEAPVKVPITLSQEKTIDTSTQSHGAAQESSPDDCVPDDSDLTSYLQDQPALEDASGAMDEEDRAKGPTIQRIQAGVHIDEELRGQLGGSKVAGVLR